MMGTARFCSKTDKYAELDRQTHPDILHRLEMTLAGDLNADDSMTAASAQQFLNEFEKEFKTYQPDRKTCDKLTPKLTDVNIRVIGGNWCSDTRREVPRLCKVLFYADFPADRFEYFRVNKQKKAIDDDFAATQPVTSVPTIFVYRNGQLLGSIVETPRKTLEADLLLMLSK